MPASPGLSSDRNSSLGRLLLSSLTAAESLDSP